MADIIKVKAKKSYAWDQDKKFIYIQIPLAAHTTMNKIDIYLSDLILRVTSIEKKQTQFLDLAQEIDYRSSENKFIINNEHLHATLKKLQAEVIWTVLLIEDISLADLKVRRRQSEGRYEKSVKSVEQNKDKLRVQYDRKATQELMRFEQEERDRLEGLKKEEKELAIRQVFSNINEKTGKIQKVQKEQRLHEVKRNEPIWKQKQKLALQILDKQQQDSRTKSLQLQKQKNQTKIIQQIKKQYEKQKTLKENNTMFTDQEIDKFEQMQKNVQEQFQEIPVRRANNQQVKFTERIFPHLAARDTYHKEPPMPKSKEGKNYTGDVQGSNPLWLKDKGDRFFKDKNYISAIEAYSEAIKQDSKFIKAYLNRSISYMKIFKLQEAIDDCEQCLALMSSQISSSEEEDNHSRVTLAKIKTRKAICLAWKGELQQSKEMINQANEISNLDQDIKNQIASCLNQIKARQQSIHNKLKGDELVKLNNHEGALSYYDKAIEVDQNQYAISNKVLCLNKIKNFKDAVIMAERAIKKINILNVGSGIYNKQSKNVSVLLLKLYYRKAKAQEQLNEVAEASETIRKGLALNSEDKDLQQFLKSIKTRQSKQCLKKTKQATVALIKQGKIKQALDNYSKCLKLLEQNEDIQQYLAILQNQCVCYQKIQQFDDVLSTCIRILKIVNNIQSKILVFGGKKDNVIMDKDQLKKISVRTLLRRANAYIKTNQYYNAKADLERAFQISPEEQIRKELQKLKNKLQSELQK